MSMIARDNGNGTNIEPLENGVYTAVCISLIDLGNQYNKMYDKKQRKMRIIWGIQNETVNVNGEELPRTISKEYSFSLHEKSALRKDLQSWRGKPFTQEELNGFDVTNLLNKACQLQIIKEEKNDKCYNNIAGIMALPQGMEIKVEKIGQYFDTENPETYIMWNLIPKFLQKKIAESVDQPKELQEFLGTQNIEEEKTEELPSEDPSDDLPF